MRQSLGLVSFVVRDDGEAVRWFVDVLGFALVEDTELSDENKRWAVVRRTGSDNGCDLLLARASTPGQVARIGSQTGGRVFLFLVTDDVGRDYDVYRSRGVTFVREPARMPYGTVAVFEDLHGNRWDLLERG